MIRISEKAAVACGALGAVIGVAGAWSLGHVTGAEGRQLLSDSLDSTVALCNTVVLGSATILALMLTILGFSSRADSQLDIEHYLSIRRIAFWDAMVFACTMVFFLFLNVPVIESDKVPHSWYATIYYISLGFGSLAGGALITIVLMLYSIIHDVIEVVCLGNDEHHLRRQDDGEESSEQREKLAEEEAAASA